MSGHVDTVYGPIPGCPQCGVISLSGPHLCEHGVTPAPEVKIELTITTQDPDLYRRMLEGT